MNRKLEEQATPYHALEDVATGLGDPDDGWAAWVRKYPSHQWIRDYKNLPWDEGKHSVLLFPAEFPGGCPQCRDIYTIEVLPGKSAEEFLVRFTVDLGTKCAVLDHAPGLSKENREATYSSDGSADFACRLVRNSRGVPELRCGNELVAAVGRFNKGKGPWWIAGFAKMNGRKLCLEHADKQLGDEKWYGGNCREGKEWVCERGEEDVGFVAVVKKPPSLFGKCCTILSLASLYADPFLQLNSFVTFVRHGEYGFAVVQGTAFMLCYVAWYLVNKMLEGSTGISQSDLMFKIVTMDSIKNGIFNDWLKWQLQNEKSLEVCATVLIVPYSLIVAAPAWSISFGVMLLSHLSSLKTLAGGCEVSYELTYNRERDLMMKNSPGDLLRYVSRVALSSAGSYPTISVYFAVLHAGELTWLCWSGLIIAALLLALFVFHWLPLWIFGPDAQVDRMRDRGTACIQSKRSTLGPVLNLWWTLAWVVFKGILAAIVVCAVPGGPDVFLEAWREPIASPGHVYIYFWTLMSAVHPAVMLVMFCMAQTGGFYPGLSFSAALFPPTPWSIEALEASASWF